MLYLAIKKGTQSEAYFNFCIYPKTQSWQIRQSTRTEGPEAGNRSTLTNTLQRTYLPGHSNCSLDDRIAQPQATASFGTYRGQKDHNKDTLGNKRFWMKQGSYRWEAKYATVTQLGAVISSVSLPNQRI